MTENDVKGYLQRILNAEWISSNGIPVSSTDVSFDILQAALERILELEKLVSTYQETETRTCIDCRNPYPEFCVSSRIKCWECRSQKELDTLKAHADELVEVICHAAPTGWAASGDLVEASEWEKAATKAVNEYAESFPYEPKVSVWEILEEHGALDGK